MRKLLLAVVSLTILTAPRNTVAVRMLAGGHPAGDGDLAQRVAAHAVGVEPGDAELPRIAVAGCRRAAGHGRLMRDRHRLLSPSSAAATARRVWRWCAVRIVAAGGPFPMPRITN
jgi:hypothetical protein